VILLRYAINDMIEDILIIPEKYITRGMKKFERIKPFVE
jgi:hypothetical protein